MQRVPAQRLTSMLTERLSEYISSCPEHLVPAEVNAKAALHLVDIMAAMVSGSRLAAGRKCIPYVANLAGRSTCTVVATPLLTTPIDAALANGMFAHADETDDSHAPSLTHPGCAVVPAALAVAEQHGRSGTELLRAVVLGYDIGTRISMALGASRFADRYHLSSHAYGGTFGATAAACALSRLDSNETANALSYTVQMVSGNRCWMRDPEHVQKAFVFGGMPASNGVRASMLAAAGFTGVSDALQGTPGLFAAFSEEADASLATELLGERFEVMRTSIKKWSVGSPIQAALDAIESIVKDAGITAKDVASISVTLPLQRARVADSAMPNVNLRHVLALYLNDAGVTFASLHDPARMHDSSVQQIANRINVAPRAGAARHEQAELTLVTTDGRTFERAPEHVRGQPANPMTADEVVDKARSLIAPVLGDSNGDALLEKLLQPESIENVLTLREFLHA